MTGTERPIAGNDRTADSRRQPILGERQILARRTLLRQTAAVAAGSLVAGAVDASSRGRTPAAAAGGMQQRERAAHGTDLQPQEAIGSILAALDRFPLVALGERHLIQEMHDLYTALLRHPALPGKVDDIVVEFGNALYQDIADRFILGDQPIARADLARIWRFTIGGGVYWDAPVYEQFFRTVRAVNWMGPPARRIRVLLGDPPFDHRTVRGVRDTAYAVSVQEQRDAHYAGVVEREVLHRGRRALLIAGSDHLLRGIHDHSTPPRPNAVSLLVPRHPRALYVVDTLVLPPGAQEDPLVQRAQANVAHWPRPAIAQLAGTWLGGT
ncbi:MAG TPA: hypothetical protein VHB98_02075, partial [Chloroflexota bacterium]|nr:hypothetical protein [Chloroflexota bacterium]